MDHPSGPDREPARQPRRRRPFSIWTVLAPAAVILLWILFFSALGNSCVFRGCDSDDDSKTASAETAGDAKNDLPENARAKVKSGDTLGSIAAKYDLTEEELKACNPDVDPQALQPNTFLFVAGSRCEDADLAQAGANPDPLAGDTTSGTDPNAKLPENGTAAADPSTKVAPDPDASSTGTGTEG